MTNPHGVPKKQWRKWSTEEQDLFNDLLSFSLAEPQLFLHPLSPLPSESEWKTTAWNFSWMAADFARERRKLKK